MILALAVLALTTAACQHADATMAGESFGLTVRNGALVGADR